MDKEVKVELRDMVDSSSLLLDENLYSKKSVQELIEAIAFAKVTLKESENDEDTLQEALQKLCDAIDNLQTREEEKIEKKEARAEQNKNLSGWKKAAPYVICGAAIVGSAAFLVANLCGQKKTADFSLKKIGKDLLKR